jgi:hypothetical protein
MQIETNVHFNAPFVHFNPIELLTYPYMITLEL